jgi:predicted secreted hydrolase
MSQPMDPDFAPRPVMSVGWVVAVFLLLGVLLSAFVGTIRRLVGARPTAGELEAHRVDTSLSLDTVLGGGDLTGFARAMAPRPFVFPEDHGPHPAFRSEWWYVTGQLRAGARRFGYQLTIFRQALAPEGDRRVSAWDTRHVYMGHLALTDVQGKHFVSFEKLAREGLELGGARAQPFRVWVEDWALEGSQDGPGTRIFPISLRARGGGISLALDLGQGRGPVLQGNAGLSAKGPQPGNASYYYSLTRLPTSGKVTIGGQAFDVEGASWMDREWSTSWLGPDLEGWDWLALHLSDGRDLMIYRLRRRDGTAAAESRATLIDDAGATRIFGADAFTLTPLDWWRSPASGARYPVGLAVIIPAASLSVQVRPLLEDQELRQTVRYWEGAVDARGQVRGAPLTGSGYLELTGYRPTR